MGKFISKDLVIVKGPSGAPVYAVTKEPGKTYRRPTPKAPSRRDLHRAKSRARDGHQ